MKPTARMELLLVASLASLMLLPPSGVRAQGLRGKAVQEFSNRVGRGGNSSMRPRDRLRSRDSSNSDQRYSEPDPNQSRPQPTTQAVVTNPAPKKTPLPKNKWFGVPRHASQRQMLEVNASLAEYLAETMQTLESDLDKIADRGEYARELLAKLSDQGASIELVQSLTRSLAQSDGDIDRIKRLCRDLGWNDAAIDEAIERLQLPQALATLRQRVDESRDGPLIASALARLSKLLARAGVAKSKLAEVNQKLATIREVSLMRQLLVASPSTGQAAWPTGDVPIVFDPRLKKGEVVVLNNDYLLAGVGSTGAFRVERGSLASAFGLASYQTPKPDSKSGASKRSGIMISNPSSTATTIKYVLAGSSYELKPGSLLAHPEQSGTIEYNRGGTFGNARYQLANGTWRFSWTDDSGWQIGAVKYQVTIDNSANAWAFGYLVDNKPATVDAGKTQEHASSWPIVVVFDRGGGAAPARKIFDGNEVEQVGIDRDTNQWDLFSAAE